MRISQTVMNREDIYCVMLDKIRDVVPCGGAYHMYLPKYFNQKKIVGVLVQDE